MRIALTFSEKRSTAESDAEFDTREAIASLAHVIAWLGHDVTPVDVRGSISRLTTRLARLAPDLVFNLAEGERGAFREAFYPALYDQLGLAHTGSGASALAICLDKLLAKRVVAAAGVRVPGEPRDGAPAIVKPNFEGSSKGIVVVPTGGDVGAARAAVRARYPAGELAEGLVPGADVAVAWFAGLGLLPAITYRYPSAAPYPIYDYALKHATPERVTLAIAPAEPRLADAAQRAIDALGIAGYGRVDFRVAADGEPIFLEANPLPSLTLAAGHDELFVAAAHAGRSPPDLVRAIIDAAACGGRMSRSMYAPES